MSINVDKKNTHAPTDDKLLGNYLESRSNNLNLIRMLAAVCVMISHAYPITIGIGAVQPFYQEFGMTLGGMSVYIFFIISGLLITQSFERRPFKVFAIARVLRLIPGLIVALLLTVFVLGPTTTSLSLGEYFGQIRTYTYLPRNLTLAALQYDLPGVFASLPYPKAINGSLWTLINEVLCYSSIVLLGLVGFLSTKRRFVGAMALYVIVYVSLQNLPEHFPGESRLYALSRLSFPFFVGIAFYKFRNQIKLNGLFALSIFIGILVLRKIDFYFEIFSVLSAYVLFYIAYVPEGFIRNYNQFGDYSYGYYIYAFPIQQSVMFWISPKDPVTHISMVFFPILILSILSWHIIEKPSLELRKKL